jgi:hypothetical protein
LDIIDLCDLPIDILNNIITRETTLLEKHILRFVCKKLHNIVHHISYSSSTKFHDVGSAHTSDLSFAQTSWLRHDSKKIDELVSKYGNADIFKWVMSIFDKGNSSKVSYNAARYGGNIKLIKYVKSLGYPWDTNVCHGAAEGGHLEILKWARENNCPWN